MTTCRESTAIVDHTRLHTRCWLCGVGRRKQQFLRVKFQSTCWSEVKAEIKNMTRGNQRDLARAKNMKKTQKKTAGEQDSNKGLTLEQRKQRDADRMREKQQKKTQDEQGNMQQQGVR